jgi:mRNA interferase HigB
MYAILAYWEYHESEGMRIENLNIIDKFTMKHTAARAPMTDWIEKTRAADWPSPADVRGTFASASFVRSFVIFNIGGNSYRLLTEIVYAAKTVSLLRAGTHDDYNRWKL